MMPFLHWLVGNKSVNLKALAILIVTPMVLGGGLYFLHAFQVKRNARDLYDRALQMEKEGKVSEAVMVLEQYLGMAPHDDLALAKFGVMLAQDAKNPRARERAVLVLDQVLRRDPNREDLRRKVVELTLSLGQFNAARHHLALLHKIHPEDVDVLHWYGRCEAGVGNNDKAAEWYGKAIKIDPQRVELSMDYAALLLQIGKTFQPPDLGMADTEVERLLSVVPKSPAARVQAARYYLRTGNLEKAETHILFATTDLRVSTEEVYLLAADIAKESGKHEAAVGYLLQGQKLYPNDGRINLMLAEVKSLMRDPKGVLAIFDASYPKSSDDPNSLFAWVNLLIDNDGVAKAEAEIAKLAAKQPGPRVDTLRARVLMRKELWGDAQKILEGATPKFRSGDPLAMHAYLLLGECYRHLGNSDKWLDACRAAVERDKSLQMPARQALADALAAQGLHDQALQEYRQLPVKTPDLQLKITSVIVTRNLRLPERDRRWKEIESELARLQKLPLKDHEQLSVKLLQANVLAVQRKLDDARKLMEGERDRDPKQVEPWLFLIQLAELTERPPENIQKVQYLLIAAEKAAGPRAEWQLWRARQVLTKNGPDARSEIGEIEKTAYTLAPADADRLRDALAEYYAVLKSGGEDAERLWKEQAKRQPKNLSVRLRLLERHYQQNLDAELVRLVSEIRQIEGGPGPLTCYAEACHQVLLYRAGDKNAVVVAREWLVKAGKARPSWSRVPLLEAEVCEAENLKERALEKYKLALDRGENRLFVVRRALQLMHEQKQYAEASALLGKLSKQAVVDAGLDRFLAQLLVDTAQGPGANARKAYEEAFKIALQSIKKDSKDHYEWLWLGQLAVLAKDRLRAEHAFRHAVQLSDSTTDTWATLILYLAGVNDVKHAEIEMQKAEAKLPPDKAALILAPANEALGKLELAEKHYLAALAGNANDAQGLRSLASFLSRTGKADRAEDTLRKLLEPRTNAPKDTAAWARRTLALTLSSRGGYPRFKEAQALLTQNRKEQPDQVEDQLATAIVLASQPAHRAEAIAALENLTDKVASLSPEMRYFLAQLYEADGKWQAAKTQLIVLLATQDKNPVFLAHYIRAMLRHNDVALAENAADKLAAVAATAWPTVELGARVLHAKGQKEKACAMVLNYAEQKDVRRDLAGLLLDELGYAADPEKQKQICDFIAGSKRPEAVLLLAQFLAKHEDVDEALDLCEAALKTAPPDRVLHTAVIVLRLGKGTPDQQAKVEGWLQKAATEQPKSLFLQILHAEVEDLRGRYAEAASIYGQILQKDQNNIIALNNLAFMTALKKENLQDSLAMIDKAIDIAGPQAQLLDTRAVVLLQMGQSQKAVQCLQQAIALGGNAENYFHLAVAQRQAKNQTAAVEAMLKARELQITEDQVHALERDVFKELLKEIVKDGAN
ncbi:MAG TPA: tetratricopeptide repeat protein [Gemmataceae bacterium]|nr:tetratricopeptide repeat protein [Gemmataceae bacterium]